MTLLYFILILSAIIFIHETGHFIFAKLFKIHVYEFSIGMGQRIFKYTRPNDETEYSIRLFPIGGYVRIAGEDENDEDDVPETRKLTSKTWLQRFIVMVAGSMFNFILAIIILFVLALTLGSVSTKPYIGAALPDYPAYEAGIDSGDLILSVNDKKVSSYDELIIRLYENNNKATTFEVQKENGTIENYKIKPIQEDGTYVYGILASVDKEYGIINSIGYTYHKFIALIETMGISIVSLISGNIALEEFSGPVGVYDIVDDQAAAGIGNITYFLAYLCINVGVINLLPLPALDGGRILFLIIEKIKGGKVNPKVENLIHYLGFIFLMGLIILITFNDIFN